MGGILDLATPDWFGGFDIKLTVHVIDSSRPQNLSTLFAAGESTERIILWDDGGVDKLEEERTAWEALTVSAGRARTARIVLMSRIQYEPEPDSDEDSEGELEQESAAEDNMSENDDDDNEDGSPSSSRKRRSNGEDAPNGGKRRRLLREVSKVSLKRALS
jgi:cell division control protein 45